jgi:hypothetical protein
MSDRRLAAILAFIAVWRQDRMGCVAFRTLRTWVTFASALNGAIFVLK